MSQKQLTVLTLLVVLAGAVGINEFIIRNSSKEQDRQVASFGERFEPEQIKWEQELAKTMSKEINSKMLIGGKPTLNEKLLFEALEGRYEAQVVGGKLLKISLMPNQAPLEINTENLLKQYAEAFKGAKQFSGAKIEGQTESVELRNKDGKAIGQVTILRNEQGLVTNIEIQ